VFSQFVLSQYCQLRNNSSHGELEKDGWTWTISPCRVASTPRQTLQTSVQTEGASTKHTKCHGDTGRRGLTHSPRIDSNVANFIPFAFLLLYGKKRYLHTIPNLRPYAPNFYPLPSSQTRPSTLPLFALGERQVSWVCEAKITLPMLKRKSTKERKGKEEEKEKKERKEGKRGAPTRADQTKLIIETFP
jgi:hypothetical protein